jgi:PAS domain S-box-containing protein
VRRSLTHLDGLDVSAEDFLAAVLETAAQPIWVVDPDGLIRFANPAAIAALGYDGADELLGRRGHETIHHQRPDGTPRPVTDCALLLPRTRGETVTVELDWFVRRDGSMFPVSYVSAPLEMPEGRGAVVAFTDIEERMRAERELREHDTVLAGQQASLRRVATLVAGGATSADVFAAIAREVGHVIGLPLVALWRYERDGTATVIGAWGMRRHPFRAGTRWPLDGPTACARVFKTGRPARIDDFAGVPGTIADAARETGICACAGAPIIVDGDVWGAMSVDSTDGAPLPDHVEDRLTEFTELVAAAISNTASREQLVRLADEQAALRRVATLVARGVRPPDLFAAVAREVGLLVGGDTAHVGRYEEGAATLVASWSPTGDHVPLGTLVPIDGENVASLVLRTGQPARMNSYEHASGPIAAMARELGIRSSVGAPIVVDGRRWGMTIVSSKDDHPFPVDTERRVAAFTELVATAISNTEARKEVGRLAEEQAALRRVATLVAQGVPPGELFAAVTAEVGRLLRADLAAMIHYETNGTVTPVATWAAAGEYPAVPDRWPTEHGDPATIVAETRRPARIDNWDDVPGPISAWIRDLGITSSVGGPILVAGDLWGALAVHSNQAEPLPANTELRLENFTELVATAISNAQARAEVARLADEQAALRRVATLVARGSPPQEVFAAVAGELVRLLPVEDTAMLRYEDDGTVTVVATGGDRAHTLDVGTRLPLDGENVTALVHRTGRPARIDDYWKATGAIGERVRDLGTASVVGFPIVIDGGLWGVMVAAQGAGEPLPAWTESRVGKFTELLATAISNVQARSDLAASRTRIVAAADEERRRVVRDLHDGAQQRLIHTIVTLRLAHEALQSDQEQVPELVNDALEQAQRATVELRELAQGILPAILTRGGLRAAVEVLASRTPVPVEVTVSVDRLPAPVEATAYFVVAEALTNVAKHSRATGATAMVCVEDSTLRIRVRDNGVGGARPDGSGIVGLADRLAALDGRLRVESPPDGGTLVAADIPIPG